MTKPLFHLIPESDWKRMQKTKMTWGEIDKTYSQPSWCDYPGALHGLAGCWSLVYRKVTGRDSCKNCDYCLHGEQK